MAVLRLFKYDGKTLTLSPETTPLRCADCTKDLTDLEEAMLLDDQPYCLRDYIRRRDFFCAKCNRMGWWSAVS